ncbi:MAG: sugar phosphate isomerase/epimerase [Acidobacteriia bacterium]|nr:sugar phosphate isomerase/epimerase [Terriglobia bacterium]
MPLSRRQLILSGLGSTLLQAKDRLSGLRIGVTDWNLRQTGKLDAIALAKRLGFDGVEVSLGRKIAESKLPLDNAAIQEQYLAEAAKQGIRLAGTCLDVLHVNYLKNDPLGQKWVADGIPITRKLKARVMLLPFFGKGALQTRQEMDYVGDVLREIAPAAEKAGVLLGLEDTISAEDNARIMERTRSRAVLTYYDIGNSTNAGFDPVKEIRWLGRDRICQFHLKDNPNFLGEGKIDFPGVMESIASLGGFQGFANLETSTPTQQVDADMGRNLGFIRRLMEQTSK